MDLTSLTQSLQTALGGHLPSILGAIGMGLLGWVLALVVRSVARRGFSAIGLDGKVNKAAGTQWPVTSFLATGLYALILLMTVIAVLNALNLGSASGPLSTLATDVLAFLPKLVAGVVLAAVAWVVATVVRTILSRVLVATSLDSRVQRSGSTAIGAPVGTKPANALSGQLAQAGFWFTLLLFLPAVLGALQLDGLLAPVQGMMTSLLGIVPNILAAAAIGVVGYLVATLLRAIVSNLLDAAGANRASRSLGLSESLKLSTLAGTVVYVLVLLPTLIAALDALKIEAISAPASAMLGQVFELIPNLIAAAVILGVTYFVARIVAGLATEFLAGVGFDTLPVKLGLSSNPNSLKASVVAGKALMFFAMLFAATEAANRLGFVQVSELAATFIKFGGDLLLGGFILTVGFWLANLTHDAIQRAAGEAKSPIARIARFAILGLVLAMGLRAMGIASDIVNLAFGLTLGAVAVAGALSFGLGGREAAGRQMEHWLSGWRNPSRGIDPNAVPLPGDTPVREGIFTPPTAQTASKEKLDPNAPN
jgi:Conserved TM helix